MVTETDGSRHILHEPEIKKDGVKYPVLVYLHGSGANQALDYSDSLADIASRGFVGEMIKRINENPDYWSSYIIMPVTAGWGPNPKALKVIIDKYIEQGEGDPDRVYLTGHSMGGMAACDFMYAYPEMVAAAVPVAGVTSLTALKFADICDIPVRLYHSADDHMIPVGDYRRFYRFATERDAENIEYFELDGFDHWPTYYVFNKTDVIDWMFRQNRAGR
jgi:predicted peptidase